VNQYYYYYQYYFSCYAISVLPTGIRIHYFLGEFFVIKYYPYCLFEAIYSQYHNEAWMIDAGSTRLVVELFILVIDQYLFLTCYC